MFFVWKIKGALALENEDGREAGLAPQTDGIALGR
jgi:hypothetical protein